MNQYPYICPDCGCPLQLLADGNSGKTRGNLADAIQAHRRVCHPMDEIEA